MSSAIVWDDYKRWCFADPGNAFRLDASRMGLTAAFVDSLRPRLARAFEEMDRLEGGAVANPDEQRRVGHYWLRAPELAPSAEIGDAIRGTIERIAAFSERILAGEIRTERGERFGRQLVVGIGGSALGPQFVADALGCAGERLRPSFLDNTDPDGIDRVLAEAGDELSRTLTIVISKSGGTPETRNGMLETRAAYARHGLEFGRHAVAITGAGSRLDRYAVDNDFLERFPMWDWVGGRTSETSVVGLLPATLQGIDTGALLAGAAAMDVLTRVPDPLRNPAALLALSWFRAGEGKGARDMVVLPYKDRLALFSRYLQQLVMESLGKKHDLDGNVVHQGLAVYGNKGSTDQHAYVQQLRDGLPNFFATFIEVLRDRDGESIEVEEGVTSGDFLQGFLLGTRAALFDSGRCSLTLTIDEVSPRSVGQLVALYERAVGLYATLVRINAYHQPGVEAGKQAAAEVLALQRRLMAELIRRAGRGATVDTLAVALEAEDRTETLFHLLERLASNPSRRVRREPGSTPFSAEYRLE